MRINKEGLINSFREAGLKEGDTVMVHSDITGFGLVENFTPLKQVETFYEAFMEVLGEEGTLCVPAYFYEYARYGIPYDVKKSPVSKELGIFPSFIHSLENSKRSYNPIVAVSAIGKNADEICSLSNIHSTGVGSVWDKLYRMNAKLMQIGNSNKFTVTFTVYIEYMAGVPYFYTKVYDIPILYNDKVILEKCFACVRYLDYDIAWNTEKFFSLVPEMVRKNVLNHIQYNNGDIYLMEAQSLFEFYKDKIFKDRYFMLKNAPKFIPGAIPNDSIFNK